MRSILALTLVLLLAGCWNEQVSTTVRLGDVSIGQQMIDLARARDEGAIDEDEYARLKSALMALALPGEGGQGD